MQMREYMKPEWPWSVHLCSALLLSFLASTVWAGSFIPRLDLVIGTAPLGVETADLDRDGHPDILAVAHEDDKLVVLRNTGSSGALTLAPRLELATGAHPHDVLSVDLDGDGRLDVVTANSGRGGGTISVFRNTSTAGSISFAGRADFSATTAHRVAAGDFNADGKIDLAVTVNSPRQILLFRNSSIPGTISLTGAGTLSTASFPNSVATADIDGDGKIDIIAPIIDNDIISIYRNQSSGGSISFSARSDFSAGHHPDGISIADFDGNAKADIVVANPGSNDISLFLNNSTPGSLNLTRTDFPAGSIPSDVATGDIDRDGRPDAVVNNDDDGLIILLNKATPAGLVLDISSTVRTGDGPFLTALGDLNDDGNLDLVASNSLSTTVSVALSSVSLRFPLQGGAPYTAEIIAVLDHNRKLAAFGSYYCGQQDDVSAAYTGEVGRVRHSSIDFDSCLLYRLSNTDGVNFQLNGRYRPFQPNVLSYDSHTGYDLRATPPSTEVIVAAADGELFIPKVDPINGKLGTASPYCGYHTFKIKHQAAGGQWETWYLHSRELHGRFKSALAQHTSNDFCTNANISDISLGTVIAGEPVAYVGEKGAKDPHLHFEVRRDGKIVDPYGWEWLAGTDPFADLLSIATPQVDPLWGNVLVPRINSVSLVQLSGGLQATVVGQNFDTTNHVHLSIWDISKRVFTGRTSLLTSHTSTQIVADLPPIPSGRSINEFALKVENVSGPRSAAVQLSLSSSVGPRPSPLFLHGTPAPGGGNYVSFGGFDALNNLGDLYFGAEIDTTGDDVGDVSRKISRVDGQASVAAFPNVSNVGAVRLNESGSSAYGDAGVPGNQALYLRPSPTATPIRIVQVGQASPVGGLPYHELRGPFAISEAGDVTFGACVYQASTNTVFCGYLFLYERSTGAIRVVVQDGTPSPMGGTFDISITTSNQFTGSGDILFLAGVNGGSASHGIFRFSRSSGSISKVVAAGDAAPIQIGGTYNTVRFDREAVSGDWFALVGDVTGGAADQVIVRIDLRNFTRQLVAYEGQLTGTPVDGMFSIDPSIPANHPFSGGWNGPGMRSDGAIVFATRLYGSTADTGSPTTRGIFLWSAGQLTKVVVDGDSIPSGGKYGGISSFLINDRGSIVFFVARID